MANCNGGEYEAMGGPLEGLLNCLVNDKVDDPKEDITEQPPVDNEPLGGLVGLVQGNTNKADILINNVIAKAGTGGFPSLGARCYYTFQYSEAGEHCQVQFPNEKVFLLMGKGGEIIKKTSGTCIQETSGLKGKLLSVFHALRRSCNHQEAEAAKEKLEDGWGDDYYPRPRSPRPVYNWDIPPPSCWCRINNVWNQEKDEVFINWPIIKPQMTPAPPKKDCLFCQRP